MNIITLFCKMDDFFLAYEKWHGTYCLPERTPLETRGRPRQLHPERSDDAPCCVPSKWVSDVQTLLRKTRLCLLVCRVSTSGELFSVCSTQERGVDAFDTLSSCPLWVNVAVSPSWIPHVCGFATISGFPHIVSSQHTPDAQRLQWDGSTVLNST